MKMVGLCVTFMQRDYLSGNLEFSGN